LIRSRALRGDGDRLADAAHLQDEFDVTRLLIEDETAA
jgi:hypothetical protein